MIFTVWNDVAPNGAVVNSRVELLMPEDDEKFPERPWRASTSVDGHGMGTSHHETRGDATRSAEGAHRAYLEVHADYPRVPRIETRR